MNMPIGYGGAHRLTLAPPALSRAFPGSLAVLVVDDEAAIRDELAGVLARRGLTVLTAPAAETALRVLAGRPDIGTLVTDIRMPGMDGLELAQQALAGRDNADALEVLLVTGHATPAHGLAAARIGAFGLLPKPTRGAELSELVQAALVSAAARRRLALGFPPRPDVLPAPEGRRSPVAAAEALLHTLAQRAIDAETLASLARQIRAPLGALIETGPQDPAAPQARRLLGLLDTLLDLAAMEAGRHRGDVAPVSAHALVAAIANRLEAAGVRASRRVILQPDARPAFGLDLARLTRAYGLLAERAMRDCPGAALAELSVDAGAGGARIELAIRPEPPCRRPDEPAVETLLPLTLARRLVALDHARLEAWLLPEGGLRARLRLGSA
jgi:CheY-like chemotaxis protein